MKKVETFLLIVLLFLSLFTHFYKLNEYFNLTDDPGRDAVAVYDILINKKLTLIGPKASTGGFYYSPLYFYLLIPFFLLTRLDPIAAPILTAATGLISVFLIFYVSSKLFSNKVAFFAAFLYSVSPFVLSQSRRGWNPSLLPLFSLLSLYFFYRFLKDEKKHFLYWWGIAFGAGLQFHFALIFSLPVYLILLFARGKKNKSAIGSLFLTFLLIIGFFLPIFLFEFRHDFVTSKSFLNFLKFGVEKDKVYHPDISISYFFSLIYQSLTALIFIGNFKNSLLFSLIFVFILVIYLNKEKIIKDYFFSYLLILFFGSFLVLGFYKGPVHPYYWIFILPFPFIITGWLLAKLEELGKLGKILGLILFFLIFFENLKAAPFLTKPKRTIKEEKEAARTIYEDAKNLKNNILINVIMFSDIDAAHSAFEYRYLVKYYGKEVLPAENYRGAEKLYIVAEQKIDDLIKQPVMEIRDFQPKRVEREWKTKAGYKIYRLGK